MPEKEHMDEKTLYRQMLAISERMVASLGLAVTSLRAAQSGLHVTVPQLAASLNPAGRNLYRQIQEFHFELAECIGCYCAQTEFFARLADEACAKLRFYRDAGGDASGVLELHRRFTVFERLVFVHLGQVSLLRDSLRTSSLLLAGLIRSAPLTQAAACTASGLFTRSAGELGRIAGEYAVLLELAVKSLAVDEPALSSRYLGAAGTLLQDLSARANRQKERFLQAVSVRRARDYRHIVLLHSGYLSAAESVEPVPQL